MTVPSPYRDDLSVDQQLALDLAACQVELEALLVHEIGGDADVLAAGQDAHQHHQRRGVQVQFRRPVVGVAQRREAGYQQGHQE